MLGKYVETSTNVENIGKVVGDLLEKLGEGGFMGMKDVRPGMKLSMFIKGTGNTETEYKGEVLEREDSSVTISLKSADGSAINLENGMRNYHMQIVVDNVLYNWKDVKVSDAQGKGNNCYVVTVNTDPTVVNRRKFTRLDLDNACTITVKESGKSYRGRMINISAGGFACNIVSGDVGDIKGEQVELYIEDFVLPDESVLEGSVIRTNRNDTGSIMVGCRMLEDNTAIRDYIKQNSKKVRAASKK